MEDLSTFLSALLDLKVLGENIEYENKGTITVPIEKVGLRVGQQRTVRTEGNKTIITEANIQVIQKDKSIIKDLDDIFCTCAKQGCVNFVLKKYAPLSMPYGKPLCMTHLDDFLKNLDCGEDLAFEGKALQVLTDKPQLESSIQGERLVVEGNYPVTISKGNLESKLSEFFQDADLGISVALVVDAGKVVESQEIISRDQRAVRLF